MLLVGLLAAGSAAGQTATEATLISPTTAAVPADRPLFVLRYANDYFTASDYYFTQGIYASYGTAHRTFFIGQEGYTPTSIADPEVRWGDRPYAGTLYGGIRGRFAERPQRYPPKLGKREWTYEALAGIIGPQAKGEQQQRYIHRLIDDEAPMGWRYQIANDVLADVTVGFRQNLLLLSHLAVDVEAEARLGTFRTRLAGGGELRVGWPFLAAVIAPRIITPFHDATLQGGFFSESQYRLRYKEIDHLIGRLDLGLQARIGNWILSYSRTFDSQEITTGRRHGWGTLGVSVLMRDREAISDKSKFSLLDNSLSGRVHQW